MAILGALGLGESGVFTLNESESDVHVVGWNVLGETWPYFRPNFVKISEIMIEIHLVPYSEHSNYAELREYVKFLKPKRVIPTVGADVEKIVSKHADAMQKHFGGLVDEMAIKQEFLMGFLRGAGKNSPSSSIDVIPDKEDAPFSAKHSCIDVEHESDKKSPGQEHESEDIRKDNLEKSVQELRDCLPSWVTSSQILDLLGTSGGNVIEAVSNFFEHETEFHEQVVPGILVSCASDGGSENLPASPIKSFPVKTDHSKTVSLSQSFKLSGSKNVKQSSKSPGKRKGNLDSKGTKRARADSTRKSTDSKQHTITKFFNKKLPVVSEDSKVEVKSNICSEDKRKFPSEATGIYVEEVNQFIQIVNGGESLKSYAAKILEKTKGDLCMALDTYYSDNASIVNDDKDDLLGSNKFKESECTN